MNQYNFQWHNNTHEHKRGTPKNKHAKEIIEMRLRGKSYQDIAAKFDMKVATVKAVVYKHIKEL